MHSMEELKLRIREADEARWRGKKPRLHRRLRKEHQPAYGITLKQLAAVLQVPKDKLVNVLRFKGLKVERKRRFPESLVADITNHFSEWRAEMKSARRAYQDRKAA